MVHSIDIADVPSTTPLFADFWKGKDSFRRLLPRHFMDPRAFSEQAALLAAGRYDRRTLCAVLREQNERFGAGVPTQRAIDALEGAGSVVVIGGQQAGLFGGPLYTVHKALTIMVLARRMQKELGKPVIPVFWIASEDSDLAEVNHTFVVDRDGRLRELRLHEEAEARLPVSRVRFGEEIGPLMDELAAALPAADDAESILADLRAAYSPGRTYPQAFGAWMTSLFGEQGLVLVDPSDVRLKRLAHPLFEREIRENSPVSAAVMAQTRRMIEAGYATQIELRDGFLTLFHQDPARQAIAVRRNGFELKSTGKTFTTEELTALLERSPESFTPNAVLRPLYQDTLFPTLAAVLGPSEIAYFTQLTLAYEKMGIPMPIVFPRSSLTLVEPKMEKLMSRLGVGLRDLLLRGERIIDDILRRELPESLAARIADGRASVTSTWKTIIGEIDTLDPTLHRTAELGSGRALRQFDFMERKIAQAARKKNGILRGQVERLVAALAPRNGLQERTLTALPFLARYGKRILMEAADGIDPFAPEHRGLVVDR
jgi:bacillithiol biosynthesis cysteine-adding enzyme BshC